MVGSASKIVDYWLADIRQATDYSPFGVTLSGRNFTLTGAEKVRHGYNGMESDPEVKGEGSSYTTEFRQLDPRLGRWFSMDPVVKPHLSPYSSMSNNPIIMIDPKGDDDYFNSDGSFSHSTKTGDKVFVKRAEGKYFEIKTLDMNKLYNQTATINILTHYGGKVGVRGKVGLIYGSTPSSEGIAVTKGASAKVYFNVSANGRGVFDMLHNNTKLNPGTIMSSNNIKSALYHERLHQDDIRAGKVDDDETFEGLMDHIKVYSGQIDHSTFDNTTEDFKDDIFGSAANYYQKAFESALGTAEDGENKQKVLDSLNNFNKTVGKKRGYVLSAKEEVIGDKYVYTVKSHKIKSK